MHIELTKRQVELAMLTLHQSVQTKGHPHPLQIPPSLQHLTETEWDYLANSLASLVMEQADATLH